MYSIVYTKKAVGDIANLKSAKLDDKAKTKTALIEKAKEEFKEIKEAFLIEPCLEKLLNENQI